MIWRKSNQPIVSIPILSSLIFFKKIPTSMKCIFVHQINPTFHMFWCPAPAVRWRQCESSEHSSIVAVSALRSTYLSLSLSPSLSVEAPPCCMWFPNICVSPGYGWILCFAQLLCQSTIHRCTSEYFACLICLSVQWSSNSLLVCLIFFNVRIESEEEQTVFYVSAVQSLEASPTITQARYQASNLVNWSVAFLWWYLFSHCFQWFSVRIEI